MIVVEEVVRVIERAMLNSERNLCIQFFGLGCASVWVSAEEIVANGCDIKDFLVECGVSEADVEEIANLGYIYITAEGIISGLLSGTSFDWSSCEDLYAALDKHSEDVVEAAMACSVPLNQISDDYIGKYKDFEEYAEELFDELYLESIPEKLRIYVDYEKYARDLDYNGLYSHHDGYVFRAN